MLRTIALPSPAFRRAPPTDDSIFGIMARESFCQVRMVERLIADDEALDMGDDGWRGFVQARVGIERELQMLRWYTGKQLVTAHEVADDPAALLEALAVPEADKMPPSLLVRTMIFDPSGHARSFFEQVDAYERFIAE